MRCVRNEVCVFVGGMRCLWFTWSIYTVKGFHHQSQLTQTARGGHTISDLSYPQRVGGS